MKDKKRTKTQRPAPGPCIPDISYLQALMDAVPSPVFCKDGKGVYTGCNTAFENYIGLKSEDILGHTVRDFASPEMSALHQKTDVDLFRTGVGQVYEANVIDRLGANRNVIFHKTVLPGPDGKPLGLVGVITDVTERKMVEDLLRESNMKLGDEKARSESIIAAISDAISIQDRDFRVLYQNRPHINIIGDHRGDHCYKAFEHKDGICERCPVEMAFRDGRVHTIEKTSLTDNGTIDIEITASPLRDFAGNIIAGIELVRDITDRKKGNELKKHQHFLEELVCDRALELTIANKRLEMEIAERRKAEEQLRDMNVHLERRVNEEIESRRRHEQLLIQQSKLAAMGEMIGAIAHQWRQPLNAIGLMIQNLQDAHTFGELDREYIEKFISDGMFQIEFMSRTIDDFRNFFRPTKEKEVFDVMKAVEEVLNILRAQLSGNFVRTGFKRELRSPIFVSGYPNEFKQVLLNLINNSKDAILGEREKGRLENNEGEILVSVHEEGGKSVISILDNGGGIPENIIDRIFEPYYTTKDPGKGTGIGLYMSKTIIENNMGGSLKARNTGGGAEFTVIL